MSKKPEPLNLAVFSSLSDMGFKQAILGASLAAMAQYAIDNIAGFPESLPDEAKDELYSGYFRHYSATHPPVVYAVISGHYIKAMPEHLNNDAIEKVEFGPDYAMAFSSVEFGKLKSSEPEKHAIVAKIRDAVQTYSSNRLRDLRNAAKSLLAPPERTRKSLTWFESMNNDFAKQEKSAKVREKNREDGVSIAKFILAKKAFWETYNR